MKFSDKRISDGRARLKRLLPDAKKWALAAIRNPDENTKVEIHSARAQATNEHVRFDNFKALVVHRTSRGWYTDIIMKVTPAGIANVMGTPLTSSPP